MQLQVFKDNSDDECILVVYSVEHVPRVGNTVEDSAGVSYVVRHVHFDYSKKIISVWAE